MAMELLFENETIMDHAVIAHMIENRFVKSGKNKMYHYLMLVIGFICSGAALYFLFTGINMRHVTTITTALALGGASACAFYMFYKNTHTQLVQDYIKKHENELMVPRHIKVFKNILFQSAGKNHAEYRLYKFSSVEIFDHYYLLKYENGLIAIDQNTFSVGTSEEFLDFIQKRIQKNI